LGCLDELFGQRAAVACALRQTFDIVERVGEIIDRLAHAVTNDRSANSLGSGHGDLRRDVHGGCVEAGHLAAALEEQPVQPSAFARPLDSSRRHGRRCVIHRPAASLGPASNCACCSTSSIAFSSWSAANRT
jgi:hypothetical protein